jgi:hypothetical protein
MMQETIVLVGTPDTGKTNFLGRMWEALRSAKGRLICPVPPDHIKYVEDALGHLLAGEFAPRSNKNISESRSDVRIGVRLKEEPTSEIYDVLVPDVTGELWKRAVETFEIPEDWLRDLKHASGAMLFVRVNSDEIVQPIDWITARQVLRNPDFEIPANEAGIPTQVQLSELLRFLEISLTDHADGSPPRVAIIVTAFDIVDEATRGRGAYDYLNRQYPLFAGKIENCERLRIKVFGASAVSGDLKLDDDFKQEFLAGNLAEFGYIVEERDGAVHVVKDVSVPLAWLVKGD